MTRLIIDSGLIGARVQREDDSYAEVVAISACSEGKLWILVECEVGGEWVLLNPELHMLRRSG